MGIITDRLAIGESSLGIYTLDVSGTLKIQSLKGSGIRSISTDLSGNFSSAILPNGTVDETNLLGLFGDGYAGDFTLNSSIISLTSSKSYNNLTLQSAQIHTNGYIVRVKGILSMSGSSKICFDGSTGNAGTSTGAGGATSGPPDQYPDYNRPKPGNGGAGNTKIANANSNAVGAVGSNPWYGSASPSNIPIFLRVGGGGGGGGAHGSTSGQTAPVAGESAWMGYVGGTGATATGTSTSARSGGGSGGSGGGICIVYAREVSANSTDFIQANGGNGGNGYSQSGSVGGGGGGGAGGTAILIYQYVSRNSSLPTVRAYGGSPGSNGSGGTSGSAGIGAKYHIFSPSLTSSISSLSFGPHPASFDTSVLVTTSPQTVEWQATDACDWITVKSGTNRTGNGYFYISVSDNNSMTDTRDGEITIGSLNFSRMGKLKIPVHQDSSANYVKALQFSGAPGTPFYVTSSSWTWMEDGTPCEFSMLDVSSGMGWTATITGSAAWVLYPMSGSKGVTRCTLDFSPGIIPDGALIRFKIDTSIMATLNVSSTTVCF